MGATYHLPWGSDESYFNRWEDVMLKASVGESSNLDPREAARETVGKLHG